MADLLGSISFSKDQDSDVCCSLTGGRRRLSKKQLKTLQAPLPDEGGQEGSLDHINLLNPVLVVIKQLQELGGQNLVDRRFRRPVGYSAMTRVHTGRLCIPMLNDSGATCSCFTEEQVVIMGNHAQDGPGGQDDH